MSLDTGTFFGGIGAVAALCALFQAYSHNKLGQRIKVLESEKDDLKADIRDQRKQLNDALNRISALEQEISKLRLKIEDIACKSSSVEKSFENLHERILNHEEKLLIIAKEVAKDALTKNNLVLRAQLNPAINTIRNVERTVERLQRAVEIIAKKSQIAMDY
ncbi:hypothetical protein [Vibrio cholerae]|uniref:hypothetical protein n=1 Tax=Vibrio cholerae TaxID=666 RepID=UPI000E0A2B7E|nr:hypothetical protein [Vibrio cholerae]